MSSAQDRFWAKVRKGSDCWEWGGGLRGNGYGQFHLIIDGVRRNIAAHRFSYELHHGPIPNGLDVMHSCDNRRCVNPAHLSVGTRSENMQDMAAKNRGTTIGQSRKTHCLRGHEFTPENTYINAKGHRRCRECSRIGNAALYHAVNPDAPFRSAEIASAIRNRKES